MPWSWQPVVLTQGAWLGDQMCHAPGPAAVFALQKEGSFLHRESQLADAVGGACDVRLSLS